MRTAVLVKEILPTSRKEVDQSQQDRNRLQHPSEKGKKNSRRIAPHRVGREEISYFQHLIFKCCVGVFLFFGGV